MNKYEELKNKIDEEIKSIKEHELKLNELKEKIDKTEQELSGNPETENDWNDVFGAYSDACTECIRRHSEWFFYG